MATTNKTTFTPVYSSEVLATNDARKTLQVQTVVSSTDTITINLVQAFTSDTKKDSAYSKAIAFNVDDKTMVDLLKSFKVAQETLNATIKARPELAARPKATSSRAISVTGAAQIDALLANGLSIGKLVDLGLLSEKDAVAYVESKAPKAKAAPKKAAAKPKQGTIEYDPAPATDLDVLLEALKLNMKKPIQKGGRK